jgi:hypothetical protein
VARQENQRVVALCLAIAMLVPPTRLGAAKPVRDSHLEAVIWTAYSQHSKLVVELNDGRSVRGKVVRIDEQGFALRDQNGSLSDVAYSSVSNAAPDRKWIAIVVVSGTVALVWWLHSQCFFRC